MGFIKKNRILNDPIYGLIEVPEGLIQELIDHPVFQRLRRIMQLGLACYVFPGGTHSRFHHALGAMHLMQQAIIHLQKQGIEITPTEEEGALIAILLHDIGHGPFSHSLEHVLMDVHHEFLTLLLMQELNRIFDNRLQTAIAIFEGTHPKKFLHQLVSSQLDMDRLDYLTRDSFFTGVSEGIVGYDRILKVLSVHNNELVVSHKGIYSIESFLVARRSMYWQVYLHKTGLCASEMLIRFVQRVRQLLVADKLDVTLSSSMSFFLTSFYNKSAILDNKDVVIHHFIQLDDIDIQILLKNAQSSSDLILGYLAKQLLHRQLLKIKRYEQPVRTNLLEDLRQKTMQHFKISYKDACFLVFKGENVNKAYQTGQDEIKIQLKNGQLRPVSAWKESSISLLPTVRYYICFPKEISEAS